MLGAWVTRAVDTRVEAVGRVAAQVEQSRTRRWPPPQIPDACQPVGAGDLAAALRLVQERL